MFNGNEYDKPDKTNRDLFIFSSEQEHSDTCPENPSDIELYPIKKETQQLKELIKQILCQMETMKL